MSGHTGFIHSVIILHLVNNTISGYTGGHGRRLGHRERRRGRVRQAVTAVIQAVIQAVINYRCVKLWDIAQQEVVHSMRPAEVTELARPGIGGHVASVAVTGDWLAAGGGPAPAVWHLKSLALATSLPCGDKEVKVVRFQEDTVMVAGRGRKLYQVNITTSRLYNTRLKAT